MIINELKEICDKVLGFTGVILDLGGLIVNMYCFGCLDLKVEVNCCCLSCVFLGICYKLNIDYKYIIDLYCVVCDVDGIKKVVIVFGVCYDLVIELFEYVCELVIYYVGGYLKIVFEYMEKGLLSMMMKLGMGIYDCFKELFEKYSVEVGKK